MLDGILTYLGNGLGSVFTFFGNVMGGGIDLFWDSVGSTLTPLGEVMLLSAIVGAVLFGIKFIRSMIPFLR